MLKLRLKRGIASLATMAVLVVSLLGAAAAPASAHASSYCEHYKTGYWSGGSYYEVAYSWYHNGLGYWHTHERKHTIDALYWHTDTIQCPYNHPV